MFEELKKRPLIGLVLAIAGGYVLAHLVIRIGGYFWDSIIGDFIFNNGWMLFGICVLSSLVFLAVWRRQRILSWLGNHKKGLAIMSVGFLFAAARGGKTYTYIAGSGGSDDAARLAANQVFVKYLTIYGVCVLFFYLLSKLIRVMRERRGKRSVLAAR